jgi:hypothetical protein
MEVILKNSVPTLKKRTILITRTNRLIMFRKIITAYSENHTEYRNTLRGRNALVLSFKAGGTYSNNGSERVNIIHAMDLIEKI